MKETRKIFFIQSLYAISGGTIAIILPLLMKERGITLISIGLIYAILPIIFQITRMAFALISDAFGRKIFFLLNGFLKASSIFIYYFAFSPFAFLGGRIVEGISNASLWSVNRAFILEREGKKREPLVKLRSINNIFSAVGRLLTGFLAIFFVNEKILLSSLVFAILIFFVALTIKEKKEKVQIKKFFQYFDLKNKHPLFLRGFFLCFLIGISAGLTGGYVLPLFLKSLSFETKNIGILLGFQTLLLGIFIFFFGKLKKKRWFLIGLFYSITLFLIGYFKNPFLISLLVLLLGITYGIVPVFNEDLFSRLIKNGSFATDIGILTLAIHLGRALSLASAGFLINLFGFWSVFFLGGVIFILFLIFYK